MFSLNFIHVGFNCVTKAVAEKKCLSVAEALKFVLKNRCMSNSSEERSFYHLILTIFIPNPSSISLPNLPFLL